MRGLLIALMLASGPTPARAWGIEGHIVIADIAEAHLSPYAATAVQALLVTEGLSRLDEIANWADEYQPKHPETGPWHYVNIPLDAPAYDAARDCPTSACVVARIGAFETILGNRAAPVAERLKALEFVVHLVGDVHQPFHVANDQDRGGNDVVVTNYGAGANLHRIWDIDLIAADDPDAAGLARRLNAAITPAEMRSWPAGTAVEWANEAHALAWPAYRLLGNPAPHAMIEVPPTYARAERPVIERQLQRAGIRLAAVLNRVLGG